MGVQIPKVLRAFNVNIEGQGYAGKAIEIKLPNLEYKYEDHLAAGMDHPWPIDLAQEKMEMELTFAEVNADLKKLVGIFNGCKTKIMCWGAINDGTSPEAQNVTIIAEGVFSKHEHTSWKSGEKTEEKYTFRPVFYKETVDGSDTTEVDTENFKRLVGGTDQLESIRAAIKL